MLSTISSILIIQYLFTSFYYYIYLLLLLLLLLLIVLLLLVLTLPLVLFSNSYIFYILVRLRSYKFFALFDHSIYKIVSYRMFCKDINYFAIILPLISFINNILLFKLKSMYYTVQPIGIIKFNRNFIYSRLLMSYNYMFILLSEFFIYPIASTFSCGLIYAWVIYFIYRFANYLSLYYFWYIYLLATLSNVS